MNHFLIACIFFSLLLTKVWASPEFTDQQSDSATFSVERSAIAYNFSVVAVTNLIAGIQPSQLKIATVRAGSLVTVANRIRIGIRWDPSLFEGISVISQSNLIEIKKNGDESKHIWVFFDTTGLTKTTIGDNAYYVQLEGAIQPIVSDIRLHRNTTNVSPGTYTLKLQAAVYNP